jgi:MATE family multidrug resistance protein
MVKLADEDAEANDGNEGSECSDNAQIVVTNVDYDESCEKIGIDNDGNEDISGQPSSDDEETVVQDTGVNDTRTVSKYVMELREQSRIIIPVLFSFFMRRCIPLTSLIFVGHIGSTELSAIGLASVTANVTGFSMLIGIAGAVSTLCSQAFGAGDLETMNVTLQRAILIVFCVVTLPVSVLWWNSGQIIALLGQDKEIAYMAGSYLRRIIPGLWAVTVGQCTQNWLHAQSRASGIAFITGTIALIHPCLCYFFVYHLDWGYRGAAVATSTSQLLDLTMLMTYVNVVSDIRAQTKFKFSSECFRNWIPYLKLGIPSLLMMMEWWAAETVIFLSGTLPHPESNVSAMSIYQSTLSVSFMFPVAISVACSTRVGNALGADEPARAKLAANVSVCATFFCCVSVSLSILLNQNAWVHVYSDDPAVHDVARYLMPFAACYVICDGMQCAVSGVLRGAGKQSIAGPINIICYVFLGLPLSVILAFRYGLGITGLVSGSLTGVGSHFLCFLVVFFYVDWDQVAEEISMKKQLTLREKALSQEDAINDGGDDSVYFKIRQREQKLRKQQRALRRESHEYWTSLVGSVFRKLLGRGSEEDDEDDRLSDASSHRHIIKFEDGIASSKADHEGEDTRKVMNPMAAPPQRRGSSGRGQEYELVRSYTDTFTLSMEESDIE